MFGLSSKKKRRNRRRKDAPPITNWIIGAIILLVVLGHLTQSNTGPTKNISESLHKTTSAIATRAPIIFDDYKNKILPPQTPTLRSEDTAIGEGAPAVCGQKVSLSYQAFREDRTAIDDSADKEKPFTFRIGDGKAMPAFERGVLGMKQGGKRTIFAPPSAAYGIPDYARDGVPPTTNAQLDVELLDVSPALPDPRESPYRVMTILAGTGAAVACGEPMKFNITMWDTSGKKLFSTRDTGPLTITPGNSDTFIGIEQGILGMDSGGIRTLIIPPDFQKTMSGEAPRIDIPLPENQTIIADVEAIATP